MKIDIHVHDTEPIELLLKSMEKNQIDKALVCSSAVAKGEAIHCFEDAKVMLDNVARAQKEKGSTQSAQEVNQALAKKLKPFEGTLYGMGKVDLNANDVTDQLESIREEGLYGVGEIIGIHRQIERLVPVLAFSSENKPFPVFIHCDFPVDAKDIKDLFALIKDYPGARIIIGHLGGNYWMDVLEEMKSVDNCLLDCSEVVNFVPLYIAACEEKDRLAFGSDFPWDRMEVNLARLAEMDIDSSVLEKIMGRNAERFLGWADENN